MCDVMDSLSTIACSFLLLLYVCVWVLSQEQRTQWAGMSEGESSEAVPARKQVVWDESNLAQNEEYRRLNPVLMKIDEPKTPFCHDDGSYVDDEAHAESDGEDGGLKDGTWDPKVNYLARRVKNETPMVRVDDLPEVHTPADCETSGQKERKRPKLVIKSEADVLSRSQELEKRQHDAEFRAMRKAVYADEGAKFKKLLHASPEEAEVPDDEDPS